MLSDKFHPTPLTQLLPLILHQLDQGHLFGIPDALFFQPRAEDPFRSNRFGQLLETPLGVAAGPHTQLSQNIVAAWITGARFIELKTIQTLDELEILKPCIDMQDEGYNCEWSQELKVGQSFEQYLDAWIIIHILHEKLGMLPSDSPGAIFNMSVGYNLEGIMKDNVQWFLNKMEDASEELEQKLHALRGIYPRISQLNIPPRISDNVTLSTMHGCPPDEIERIARYLLSERKLHTAVKLNPTLLGKETLQQVMEQSGFDTKVPDQAFEHDLKYPDALQIIRNLQQLASENGLQFSLKLTNTLESINHKDVFPPEAEMMYNSGRSLHPLSVQLALKLQNEFNGMLDISFSGGAHALNISELLACGLDPVTVCTDLLKPGGYGRMKQYVDHMREAFDKLKATSIDDFIMKQTGQAGADKGDAVVHNLKKYATQALQSPLYKKESIIDPSIKTSRPLGFFDCIHAPCTDTCPTGQDIANYNYHTSRGKFDRARQVVEQTNPFPRTTGMICDHLCQLKCTRINYDEAIKIREIKRFVAENGAMPDLRKSTGSAHPISVAVIGAGPSGLSAARFLAQAGFRVDVFEAKARPGGMISGVIPPFRLTGQALDDDIKLIEAYGVQLHFNKNIDREAFDALRRSHDYVYISAGAQRSAPLRIEGIDTDGVLDPLHLLEAVKDGKHPVIGPRVAIIGGGNTAMDAARTAYRLAGPNGRVTVVYRRTLREMPADLGEIKAVQQEGMEIMELTAPLRINSRDGRVSSITCCKMELGEKDASGRRRPVAIAGSEIELPVDTVIPAVGQELAFDFGTGQMLHTRPRSYETQLPGVFIGGDALRGASTAINAIGDGRKTAQEIIDREKVSFVTRPENQRKSQSLTWHMTRRAQRIHGIKVKETPLDDRMNFQLIASTISREEAMQEAERCLLCDEVCSICTTVCPNLAFFTYQVQPRHWNLQMQPSSTDGTLPAPEQPFRVNQGFQILHIADWCNQCGNCNTFCPSADAPWEKKPHLFLDRRAFMAASAGFFLEQSNGTSVLHRRVNDRRYKLTEMNDHLVFETEEASIRLQKNTMEVIDISPDTTLPNLQTAAEMHLVMLGAQQFWGASQKINK